MSADNRYEVITWRGYLFDRYTVAAIEAAEQLYGSSFVIAQGSYNAGGVSASAGTHDGGGAVDVEPGPMPNRTVRCLRAVGFAAWHRLPSEGPWGEHVHAVLIGNAKLSPSASRQVASYEGNRNGLKTNLPDNTWHPNPIPTFVYQEDWLDMATKQEISDLIDERLAAYFRDSDGGLPDASNLRIKRARDGQIETLGHLAQQVYDLTQKG